LNFLTLSTERFDLKLKLIFKVFCHSRKRKDLYKETCPGLPLPPDPAPTRFGKWVEAVVFSCKYFDDIKKVDFHL
jgi:hypothetical protein